jgi:diadenosine tetraphosphate (Ap4A) HIT family hydrolase
MNCPFCNLDKERNRIVEEKKHVLVMLSNPRLVDGHLLVISKRHIEKPSEMTADERKELFETVLEYQEKILSKFASGCDIRQNCRPFQKQDNLKVDHIHFHLLPREFKDDLYQRCQKYETDIFRMLTEEEKVK